MVQFNKTPATVFCEDRVNSKQLPEAKKEFGYSEEIILNGFQIEYIKVGFYYFIQDKWQIEINHM